MENRSGVNPEVSKISTTKDLGSIRYTLKEQEYDERSVGWGLSKKTGQREILRFV